MRLNCHLGRAALLVSCVCGLFACDKPRSADLREWSARDHDPAPAASAAPARTTTPNELASLAWSSQCATCHGNTGRGDGPQGGMVHAPDLSRPDWQAKVSDAEIATVISAGRGSMPKFAFGPELLNAVVAKVRSFRAP